MPREPWIKVKIGIRRSGKIAGLPSDSARLGWFYVLVEAKVQRHLGVFDNRAHFVEVLGRFGRFFDAYNSAGLLHVAPDLCDECRHRHRSARRGQVVVHDYLREQRDPTNADRQAAYREAHGGDDDSARDDDVTASVTPPITATVTDHSRARATTATVTTTTTDSLQRDSSPPSGAKRADVQALLERGWTKVTRAQRKVLDEVLGRHDVTGPEFAAEVIRNTPPEHDPLSAVMDADRRWQEVQRRRADVEQAEWDEAKRGDAETAAQVLDRVLA